MRRDDVRDMKRGYSRLMSIGLGILLLAFALVIFKPLDNYSLWIALPLFILSVLPLELARRTARRMAITMLRDGQDGDHSREIRNKNRKA